ncbi:phenylalanine--tRNA ligase subunit beta, partial [Patescibacteria group bacterium]
AISNVVDVTNAVMLELGQPLHAFDFDKIKLPVTVRRAKKNEKIKLLDEQTYKLSEKDIVIADAKGPIALAGVMGGYDSAVTSGTQRILLEAANFKAESVRETRVRLNLKTDASDRFEKGIDPNLAEKGAARAVEIMTLLGGKVVAVNDMYPKPVKPWMITLELSYVEKLLGVKVPTFNIAGILGPLGVAVKLKGRAMQLTIPTVRLDLQTQEDVIEDIGRIYGYEHVQPRPPMAHVQAAKSNEFRDFERAVKDFLVGVGFSEVLNYSFYSLQDAELLQIDLASHFELANPINPDQALLRASLVPGILKNVRDNLRFSTQVKVFESGRAFERVGHKLPKESRMLVGAVVLNSKDDKKADSFFATKGVIQALLERIGIMDCYFDSFEAVVPMWHAGRVAQVKIEGANEAIGCVGEVHPQVLAESDITKRVVIFEFDVEQLIKVSSEEREYQPIRKHPTIERDISMIASGQVRVDDVLQIVQAAGGSLVLDADLFDMYDFEDGTSSLAFHVLFGADDRTLQSREVDELMEKISASLEGDLQVKVRK